MKQTAALVEEEKHKKSSLDRRDESDASKFFQADDGVFKIQPIVTCGEYVAVAPLQPETISAGGIIIPQDSHGIPDVGIVLSYCESCGIPIGTLVKYSGKHVNTVLTSHYPHYGDALIVVIRVSNIFAILPPVKYGLTIDQKTGPTSDAVL